MYAELVTVDGPGNMEMSEKDLMDGSTGSAGATVYEEDILCLLGETFWVEEACVGPSTRPTRHSR